MQTKKPYGKLLPLLMGIFAAVSLFAGCRGLALVRNLSYKPGIYEGSGRGYRGSVIVQLQLAPGGIEGIEIISHSESVYPGEAAMEELLELVLEYGSADLDAVSGATYSSRGFLEAVEDALQQAR